MLLCYYVKIRKESTVSPFFVGQSIGKQIGNKNKFTG